MSTSAGIIALQSKSLALVFSILLVSALACGSAGPDATTNSTPTRTPTAEISTAIPLTGGVAFTFDDSYVDEWFSHRELLATYGAKVTFFITRFDYLSEGQLNKLSLLKQDGHEIASHGLRHLGVDRDFQSDPASAEQYLEGEVLPSVRVMTEAGFPPESFAYPLGERTAEYDQLLLSYFSSLRGTAYPREDLPISDWDEVFFGCADSDSLVFGVGIDGSYGYPLHELKDGLIRAADRDEVIVLYGHNISDADDQYLTSPDRLEELLKFAKELGLQFFTISQLQLMDLENCAPPWQE